MDKSQKEARLASLQTEIKELHGKDKRSADEGKLLDTKVTEAEGLLQEMAADDRITALETKMGESRGRQTNPTNPSKNSLEMPDKDFTRFSVLRCASLVLSGKKLDGIEGEVQAEMNKRYGESKRGNALGTAIRIPFDLRSDKTRREQRALDTSTGAGGVNTTVMYNQFIDLLRNQAVVNQAGARVLADLNGLITLPRLSGGATAAWVTEGNAPAASNQTMDTVSLAPKTIAAYTDITRKFALETGLDAEALVRSDLAKQLSLGIDLAALNGSGVGATPTGILQDSGVTAVDFANADAWTSVVKLETTVAAANGLAGANVNNCAYITNPNVRGNMKTTAKFTNTGFPVWENGDIVNGYKAFATNQMSASLSNNAEPSVGVQSDMIFGNFDDLIIALWGGLDVLVDPYTGSSTGAVRITIFQDCDIKMRHKASFAKGYNILDS